MKHVSDQQLHDLAIRVGETLQSRNLRLATAESCTGGWVAKVLTDIPGSSNWFDRGFISYSNAAKVESLGVKEATLIEYGAVSAETVAEMAAGALTHSAADMALAVSGIAGPDGGTADKPVGTIYLAWMLEEGLLHTEIHHFEGDREAIRRMTVAAALEGLLDVLALQS